MDIRRALLDADVNYKTAKTFTERVSKRPWAKMCLRLLSLQADDGEIVHDETYRIMGGATTDINLKGNPSVILIAGLARFRKKKPPLQVNLQFSLKPRW
jgi:signal recognition particle subunit SRP54